MERLLLKERKGSLYLGLMEIFPEVLIELVMRYAILEKRFILVFGYGDCQVFDTETDSWQEPYAEILFARPLSMMHMKTDGRTLLGVHLCQSGMVEIDAFDLKTRLYSRNIQRFPAISHVMWEPEMEIYISAKTWSVQEWEWAFESHPEFWATPWRLQKPLPPSFPWAATARVIIDNRLYSFGGDRTVKGEDRVSHVQIFDEMANAWRPLKCMRYPRAGAAALAFPFYHGASGPVVFVLGGLLGGRGGSKKGIMEMYDVSRNVWRDMPSPPRLFSQGARASLAL